MIKTGLTTDYYRESIDMKVFLENRKKIILAEAKACSHRAIKEEMEARTKEFFQNLGKENKKRTWEIFLQGSCISLILLLTRKIKRIF